MLTIFQPMQMFIKKRLELFLAKRIPKSTRQTLSNRNIFIFPSKFGIAFLFFVLLLFVLGTNYQNNIILLLSYLLVSFFITAMLHSFFNFSGVTLEITHAPNGFAKQVIEVPVKITSTKNRFDFFFQWPEQNIAQYEEIHQGENLFTIPFSKNSRGHWQAGRLKVFSYYGFGLFTTWSKLDFGLNIITYPEPQPFDLKQFNSSNNASNREQTFNHQQQQLRDEQDEFFELRAYRQGESYNHVAWKQVAKGQGWLTKKYQQNESAEHSLQLQQMPSAQLEEKLAQLCFIILEYSQLGLHYRVELFEQTIDAGEGETHLKACLTALALYGLRKND